MDLKDLIEDGVLRYDGYEGTKIRNLSVVGWNGLFGNAKKYIVTCSVCSPDFELHGEGYFAMSKGHLMRNCLPCGCSDKSNWTEEQYVVRIKRVGEVKGFTFLGWEGNFSTANKTVCMVQCSREGHGKARGPISVILAKIQIILVVMNVRRYQCRRLKEKTTST